jgi:membrane associated rhomboid family serine protease
MMNKIFSAKGSSLVVVAATLLATILGETNDSGEDEGLFMYLWFIWTALAIAVGAVVGVIVTVVKKSPQDRSSFYFLYSARAAAAVALLTILINT